MGTVSVHADNGMPNAATPATVPRIPQARVHRNAVATATHLMFLPGLLTAVAGTSHGELLLLGTRFANHGGGLHCIARLSTRGAGLPLFVNHGAAMAPAAREVTQ